jgi:serine/threonine protein kinase
MTDPSPDDDRTVIRPAATGHASPPPAAAPAAAAPAEAAPPPADAGNTLPPGTKLGEFEITDVVGEGGFGIVYLAIDHSLERRIALKEYMPSALAARGTGVTVSVKSARHRDTFEAGMKSFINEAKMLALFDHPSLVKVYRFWEANGTAYMVMPFYEGITLKDKLRDLGAPPDEAYLMALLDPLTEALEVLHREQIYHRDIAPDNILLLQGSERPLLLDFGAARRVIGDMTQALTVILKSGYAPIEQYAEVPGMKQGAWTDVYALAAVVYYAINGKTPPPSVGRLVNDAYQPLQQSAAGRYSDQFLAAIDRALTVKPDARTQSVNELRRDLGLEEVASAAAPQAPRRGAFSRSGASGSAGKNRLPMIVGAAVVGLAAVGFGLYAFLSSSPKRTAPGAATSVATTPPSATATAPASMPVSASPAPVAPPQVARAAFDPVDELQRIVAAQTPGFTVEAAPSKPAFRIGKDKLSFTLKTARAGYAYVLLLSADGTFIRLFPNSTAPDNMVRAGQVLTLPQATWPMDISGPAGTDRYLAIVSAQKREFGATGMVTEGGMGEFPRAAAEAAAREYTGPGSVFAGRPECAPTCADEYGAAQFSIEIVN